MSVVVSSWVWEHAPVKSGELVVLLKMADNAHDDGGGIYPSQAELAEKSRMTERQIRNCLGSLEEKRLIRKCGTTAKGIVVWRILMTPENFSGGSGLPTEPSVLEKTDGTTPKQETLEGEARPAPVKKSRPVTYRGARVPPEQVRTAAALLDAFNAEFGRALTAWTEDGKPQPVLRQIIGALRTRPDVPREDWLRAIQNTAKNPPGWAEDRQMQIGDVFGEKAAGHALANTGVPAVRNGRARASNSRTMDLAKRMAAGEFGA